MITEPEDERAKAIRQALGIEPPERRAAITALDNDAERIVAIINRIYASTTCSVCSTPLAGALRVWANLSHVPLSPRADSGGGMFGLSTPSLPCIVVQCATCGLTHLHDAALLGLIPDIETKP